MKYEVKVCGAIFYETEDIMAAYAIAENYKRMGWRPVEVITTKGSK